MKLPTQISKIMEYMKVKACLSGVNFDVHVVYCYLGTSVISFCEELTDILENNITGNKGYLLLLGDFNIHLDKQDAPDNIFFKDFLDSFGLTNHVKQPINTSSHILDLVITQSEFCQTLRTVEQSLFVWSLFHSCVPFSGETDTYKKEYKISKDKIYQP